MKYILLKFCLLFLPCTFVWGQQRQYVQQIDKTAEPIQKSPIAERVGKNKSYWVCNEARVTFRAGLGKIFAEPGTTVTISGGSFAVYIKKGATLNIYSGRNHQVYFEIGARIVESRIGITRFVSCEDLVFDYLQAPSSSCKIVVETIGENSLPVDSAGIYQNPDFQNQTLNNQNTNKEITTNDSIFTVPANAIIFRASQQLNSLNGDQQILYLCKDARLSYTGNRCVFYLEQGAELQLKNGDGNQVYLKAGASLGLGNGNGNVIYKDTDAQVIVDQSTQSKYYNVKKMSFDFVRNFSQCD